MNCEWRYQYENFSLLRVRQRLHEQQEDNFIKACKDILFLQSLPVASNRKFQRNQCTHAQILSLTVTIPIMFLKNNVVNVQKLIIQLANELEGTYMGDFASF